jgi:sRNA-binding carbon storage regulator CsrA
MIPVILRGEGESVRVGDRIVVTVVEVGGEYVLLRVTGPSEMTIRRAEDLGTAGSCGVGEPPDKHA